MFLISIEFASQNTFQPSTSCKGAKEHYSWLASTVPLARSRSAREKDLTAETASKVVPVGSILCMFSTRVGLGI